MARRLRVHLGRDEPKSVELEDSTVEVTDDFVIEIENHGPPQHVHVAPAEDLGRFTTVTDSNHFIDAGDAHLVRIEVDEDRPAKFDGQLKIVTGYGTDETLLGVNLRQEGSTQQGVAVDESLGRRQEDPPSSPTLEERLTAPGTGSIIGLSAMAILIAIGAILVISEFAVVLGALAVLVGVGIAILLLIK